MFTLQATRKFISGLLFCLLTATLLTAQTTEFTYQGKLTDNAGTAASYDFEFRLFDAASGGASLGTQTRLSVPVSSGVFNVLLDFAAQFTGANRFLEISVRPAGSASPFTVLAPRQPITSAPYAIRSLNSTTADTAINSTQLGGSAANQFVQTGDSRLTDDRNPLAGSGNYIQNTFIQQQANASFNIAGVGRVGGTFTANLVRSNTQYDIGLSRVLSIPGTNTFVGSGSGFANTDGTNNSFFGFDTGKANTTGSNNSFFGKFAGDSNTDGGNNSFFGESAGTGNGSGGSNSFFGYSSGLFNTNGSFNSFFGRAAGDSNTDGNFNAFFGYNSGSFNTSGDDNAFFGRNAGNTNTIGTNNTIVGADADVSSNNLAYATAIGAGAVVSESNTIVLGRGNFAGILFDKVLIPGYLKLGIAAIGGSNALCLTAGGLVSQCSSSLRYKTKIASFNQGLKLINQLRPITFDWKEGGMRDLGLGAEDVEKIEPLLVTYNKDGQVEGVKYDRLGVVLLNAVKEQQAQIQTQQENAQKQQILIEQQQIIIDGLRKIVCSQSPTADICKEPKQ